MAYLTNTSVNGDLGVSGLVSVGSVGLKFTSGIINIFGTTNSDGTGSNSISIGSGAAATNTYGVAIGYGAKATTGTNIGYAGSAGTGLYLGAQGSDKAWWYKTSRTTTAVDNTSDIRDKTDSQPLVDALGFINTLTPITFVENLRDDYINDDGTFDEEGYLNGTKKGYRRCASFSAQDLYEKEKQYYNSDNYAKIVDYSRYNDPNNSEDSYAIATTALIPFLVRSIQELTDEINKLKEEINNLKNK